MHFYSFFYDLPFVILLLMKLLLLLQLSQMQHPVPHSLSRAIYWLLMLLLLWVSKFCRKESYIYYFCIERINIMYIYVISSHEIIDVPCKFSIPSIIMSISSSSSSCCCCNGGSPASASAKSVIFKLFIYLCINIFNVNNKNSYIVMYTVYNRAVTE